MQHQQMTDNSIHDESAVLHHDQQLIDSSAAFSSPPIAASASNYTIEYLAQLLKDKKQLAAFPNVFHHTERLIDDEINKVRVALFQFEFTKDNLSLPEPDGDVATMQERVLVPAKEYPDYNFVGRILGPRGFTAKQLEQETGCKIMVRGRGSMRDKKKEELNRGKPNWEHLNEELHVLIQCEDTQNRAKVKLHRAVQEVRKLLVPAAEGEDDLKRKQLMELAIINGTYRPSNQAAKNMLPSMRLLSTGNLPSPLCSPTLGAPIILSPTHSASSRTPTMLPTTSSMAAALSGLVSGSVLSLPPSSAFMNPIDYNGQLFLNPFDASSFGAIPTSNYQYAAAAMLGVPFLGSDYQAIDFSQPGGGILCNNQRRILGQTREHPYQRTGSINTPTS